jgi:hypothetical protein
MEGFDKGFVGLVVVRPWEDTIGGSLMVGRRFALKSLKPTWLAIPDHEIISVTPIESGLGVAIVFGIYEIVSPSSVLAQCPKPIRDAAETLITEMEAPFGLILNKRYTLGATQLSSFDAVVVATAEECEDIDADVVPILMTQNTLHFRPAETHDDPTPQVWTCVRPFTLSLIEETCSDGPDTTSTCWRSLKDISFYDLQSEDSGRSLLRVDTSTKEINGCATIETATYMGYALICRSNDSDFEYVSDTGDCASTSSGSLSMHYEENSDKEQEKERKASRVIDDTEI